MTHSFPSRLASDLIWIERRKESDLARCHDAAVAAGDEAPELAAPAPRGKVWRTSLGWGMALMFDMTSLATYSMFTWLPKILTEAGATPAFGGAMVALYSALGLVSALTIPALDARVSNPFPIVLACAACHFGGFAGRLLTPLAAPLLWVPLVGGRKGVV